MGARRLTPIYRFVTCKRGSWLTAGSQIPSPESWIIRRIVSRYNGTNLCRYTPKLENQIMVSQQAVDDFARNLFDMIHLFVSSKYLSAEVKNVQNPRLLIQKQIVIGSAFSTRTLSILQSGEIEVMVDGMYQTHKSAVAAIKALLPEFC